MAQHHHNQPAATTTQRLLRRALQPLVLVLALLLAAHRLPAAEARDEARLRAHLAEAFGAVDQAKAIQEITSRLTAELGRSAHLTLFGAQARAAARGILSALVTHPGQGCLQWDCSVPGSGAQSWVASSASVRAAVARGFARQGGVGKGREVFLVVENIDRIDCSNVMYLNNIMAVISEYAEAKSADGPTFLFLFETDVDRRAALERGVKTYWVEQIEAKCNPGPALNLKAFFGRLSDLTLAPPPTPTPRDTQPLCKGLSGAGGGPFGLNGKGLVFACLGLAAVVAGTTYALSRGNKGGKGRGGDDKGHVGRSSGSSGGSSKPGGGGGGSGGAPPSYTPVIGDAAGSMRLDEAAGGQQPFSPAAVRGGGGGGGSARRKSSSSGGDGAASARAMAASASVSPTEADGGRKTPGRTSTRSKTPLRQRRSKAE